MAGLNENGTRETTAPPAFRAPYSPPDEDLARRFLAHQPAPEAERRIDALATRLIEAIRSHAGGLGGIEDFLHAYSLSTQEGLALMVLAEALLRVPDAATTDRLIEDKLSGRDWSHPDQKGDTLLVAASAWTLGISARLITPGQTPDNVIEGLARRVGLPALRLATRQAMRLLGSHFVHGQTIEEALDRATSDPEHRYSFDMLGEGARTAKDAERYLHSYAHAIDAIGKSSNATSLHERPGISVKLSALHPRYEAVSQDRVIRELGPRLLDLARKAKHYDLPFTVDAEEADRLELSLAVIGDVLRDPSLAGWDGFGLAVQAYQKRAPAVINWLNDAAAALSRRLMVRLVKGAYWDTEVKRAQERGLADYPVFTRKAMTDLCYMDCVSLLLKARPRLYPQFATHNALTVASVIEDAGGVSGYEFQRLHGMGVELYDALRVDYPDVECRVYAPVGGHRDLLAYLVRRLLENGANTSFVSVSADPNIPIETILMRPRQWIASVAHARHPKIPLPRDLYAPERKNSPGVEFGDARCAARPARRDRRREARPCGAVHRRRQGTRRCDARGAFACDRRVRRRGGGGGRGRRARRDGRSAEGLRALVRDTGRGARAHSRSRRGPARTASRRVHCAAADRGRQDARRLRRRMARGDRLLPLLRRAGAHIAHAADDAGSDRRNQRIALSRPRRVRLHRAVEFSAGDLSRPGHRGAGRGQCGGGEAGRADAAGCVSGGAAAA